ncbi:LacI family DNA-binding transcriptional regulator [Actinomyces ruminicola]|uniref:Transcriptional regulator, LacI family n=1 Tax=Actinomyces ruminicola TaxID=332524 RepID=A0A1G9ZJW2_9ACTO|nr:substrate-binding domain-containing protein [Actinomyces ruminicola]SDN21377.1 transcriptional regulator, LacI family [Actinomyces ruminicola]
MARAARRRPSMIDVGRAAGVSAQTVSRYFNGGYVSADARERVAAAVNELGYVRNRIPLQMKAQRTNLIGLVLLGPLNYGNAGIMRGLTRAARECGQTVMITHMEHDPADGGEAWQALLKEIDTLLSMRVDALIVGSPYASITRIIAYVNRAIPLVALAELPESEVDAVGSYSYEAACAVMRHLIAQGHRRILHVSGPSDRAQAIARRRAYETEMAVAGLEALPVLEGREWDAASGAECARQVEPGSFTAVFAGSDGIALGFISELRRRGVLAPRDYAIAGFDDMPDAQFMDPPLTTARIDFERIGEAALRRAVSRAGGEVADVDVPRPELIVRASTTGNSDCRV